MSQLAARFLTDCLIATGADPIQAARAVAVILPAAVAAEIIPKAHLERWEMAARCYLLRRGNTIEEVRLRLNLGRRWVIMQTARHGRRVRAGYKAAAAA